MIHTLTESLYRVLEGVTEETMLSLPALLDLNNYSMTAYAEKFLLQQLESYEKAIGAANPHFHIRDIAITRDGTVHLDIVLRPCTQAL